MIYTANTVLFAGPNDEECLGAARQYITDMGLTAENVRIRRFEDKNQIIVIAKTEIEI